MNDALISRATNHLSKLFHWYAVSGTEQNTREERQAIFITAIVILVGSVSLWGWALFYLLYDEDTWPAALLCMLFSVTLFAPAILRRNQFAAEIFISLVTCCIFSGLAFFYGAEAGLNMALLVASLFLAMASGTKRLFKLAISITPMLFLFGALPIWFPEPHPFFDPSAELLNLIYKTNVANLIGIVLLCVLVILRRAERAEEELDFQYKRSESLLANLLPTEISERLKKTPGMVIADEHPDVTILFADIVGFTPRAASMKPDVLVGLLNRIFSAFDDLTAKHGLEKIKTIGDAYMVAGGMPAARADHAHVVATMALEMIKTAQQISDEIGDRIDIRIGLHSGAAVAGVIGSKKVFYDVWGETVNTASRMESHGEPGRIQVNNFTRCVLEPDFCFERRGMMDIKGMGPTEVYWMTGKAKN